ncbi:MAG: beta-N-acetylhexosaminidase [Pontibacterium sp.]
MAQGTLILDLDGICLTAEERKLITLPQVGGIILFGRNTESAAQLAELVSEIRSLRDELVIGIDQEGGRVQRLRQGVTRLPPMAALGRLYQADAGQALHAACELGYLMAAELRSLDVDLSFAPVLDVDCNRNTVIGDRAFALRPEEITLLAGRFVEGMREAGMAATGKHFPGHGWANADTHHADAVDERKFEQIWAEDLVPFKTLVRAGLEGIMPAHVLYPACAPQPAGYSEFWLQAVLRDRLGFKGVIFSDDLSMKAAHAAGGYTARARMALAAGCDALLPCNNREGALEVLDYLRENNYQPVSALEKMRGQTKSFDAERLDAARILAEYLGSEWTDA